VYVSPITWLDCDKEHTHGLRLMQARGRTGALAWPRHGQTNHVVPATPGEHATPGRTAPGADHCVGGPCRRRPDHAGRGRGGRAHLGSGKAPRRRWQFLGEEEKQPQRRREGRCAGYTSTTTLTAMVCSSALVTTRLF
jgi:hypothetical protein